MNREEIRAAEFEAILNLPIPKLRFTPMERLLLGEDRMFLSNGLQRVFDYWFKYKEKGKHVELVVKESGMIVAYRHDDLEEAWTFVSTVRETTRHALKRLEGRADEP